MNTTTTNEGGSSSVHVLRRTLFQALHARNTIWLLLMEGFHSAPPGLFPHIHTRRILLNGQVAHNTRPSIFCFFSTSSKSSYHTTTIIINHLLHLRNKHHDHRITTLLPPPPPPPPPTKVMCRTIDHMIIIVIINIVIIMSSLIIHRHHHLVRPIFRSTQGHKDSRRLQAPRRS